MAVFDQDYVPCPDPIIEFDIWMKKAMASDEPEPTAMALATVGSHGKPRNRTVLYKGMIDGAISFFTNYESDKAQEIESFPHVALCFHWKKLELQIRVEGRISKVSRSESEKYFLSRPRESQIGAWVSSQSRILSSRKDLENKKSEIENKFLNKQIPCPPFWGGFKVTPELFEFWLAGSGRLHNRFLFIKEKKSSNWAMNRLWP